MIQDSIDVSVVFALPDEQRRFMVTLPPTATVGDAIAASGVLGWYPQIDLAVNKVGVYGKAVPLTQGLNDEDRVEIYRPITADPKSVRQKRASEASETPASPRTGDASC